MLLEAWRGFDSARSYQPSITSELQALLGEGLPSAAGHTLEALQQAGEMLDASLAQPRPRFFSFVGSSGLEIGVVGDALASCFDVNMASWAAAATELEAQTIRWVSEFVGYPAAVGTFTSGGTISNMTAFVAARERALPGSRRTGLGDRAGAVYCSAEAHYSVVRAAELLGIGSDGVRALPTDSERMLSPEAVEAAIKDDRNRGMTPIAVVATAGSTLTGAVDPIDGLADVCDEHGVWLHVDGAYGLPAAATEEARSLFSGLERADSVSVDAHKWLYVPKACGIVLVKRREDLLGAFAHDEGYFPHERGSENAADLTLEYSRPLRALKLWLAFKVHGSDALRAAISENLRLARLLHSLVEEAPELEVLGGSPSLSIVPFRHGGALDMDEHNAWLSRTLQDDGSVWVSPASIDQHVWLRPCVVNFRTTEDDVQYLVDIATRVGNGRGR